MVYVNAPSQRYQSFYITEKAIERVLCRAIRERAYPKVTDVCEQAGISKAAFYKHYGSLTEARDSYERKIQDELYDRITIPQNRHVRVTICLTFLRQHRTYFRSSLAARDYYVLNMIIESIQPVVSRSEISIYSRHIYAANVSGLIYCWAKEDNFSKEKIPFYVNKIMSLRLMSFD